MSRINDVLNLMNKGLNQTETAKELSISPSRVSYLLKKHRKKNKPHEDKEHKKDDADSQRASNIADALKNPNELDDNFDKVDTAEEVDNIPKLRNSNYFYNVQNPQAEQREEVQEVDIDPLEEEVYINLEEKEEEQEHEEEEENIRYADVSDEMLEYELLGLYESVNLILDNFDFYESKPIQKGKLKAIVSNFKSAYPNKHFANSKMLFWTLISGLFLSNIKMEKVKGVQKRLFDKFKKK